MDSELRDAERLAAAGDRDAKAKVALIRFRAGDYPRVSDLKLLGAALGVAWVSCDEFAAMRIGDEVCVVRPGKLEQVEGFRVWMQIKGRARTYVPDPFSRNIFWQFVEVLRGWFDGDLETEVLVTGNTEWDTFEDSGGVERRYRIPARANTEVVDRTKEIWPVEIVRLAVGLEALEPLPEEVLRDEVGIVVGPCHQCNGPGGRTRECGHRLCYDCRGAKCKFC